MTMKNISIEARDSGNFNSPCYNPICEELVL